METKRRNVSCPATSNQITVAVKSVATGFGAAVVIKGRRRRQLFARRPTTGIPRLTLCANGRDRHLWQRSEAARREVPGTVPPTGTISLAPEIDALRQSSGPAPVGDRIALYHHHWRCYTADPFVLSVVSGGYCLIFSDECDPPALVNSPVSFQDPENRRLAVDLQDAVDSLLDKQAIEVVSDPGSPGFYSRLFLVPKKDGGCRPVIDLKALNQHLLVEKFKMETPASIAAAMRPGDWATSIDLKDAYFHILIAPSSRKYLRFVVNGTVYQFRALPFGLAPAPQVFTKVMGAVVNYAHRRGIRLHIYLDDWLIRALQRLLVAEHTAIIQAICLDLGLIVNYPKSSLTPTQDFEFLGTRFDTVAFHCYPSEDRFSRLQSILRPFLERESMPIKAWRSLIGTLKSLDFQVPYGRLYRRTLQREYLLQWDRKSDIGLLPVSVPLRNDLRWWIHRNNVMTGQDLRPFREEVIVFTDASLHGWGAHIGSSTASGIWPKHLTGYSINWLELEAIRLALIHFQSVISNKSVLIKSDNCTAIAYVNKQGGTRSSTLLDLTFRLFNWTRQHHVLLKAEHIAGVLNVRADRLSRQHQVVSTEWSLHPDAVQAVWARWGTPHIDLFATSENHKLPVYVAPFLDPQAWKIDAMTFSWSGLWAYAFPPTALIPKILHKIREENVEVIMIAPYWPKRPWTIEVVELATEPPRALPLWETLLRQPASDKFHRNPEAMRLHAWRLSSKAGHLPACQTRWRRELPEASFAPLLS